MPKIADTISSKRGKNRLLKSGDKLVTRTLKLLDMLWRAANKEGAHFDTILTATREHREVLAYIKPKLQAIAPMSLDSELNVIAPEEIRQLLDIAKQAMIEAPYTEASSS